MSKDAAASQLKSFVERIERNEQEIAELNADKRDIYAEAKAGGFDVKALRTVIGIRRKDKSELQEHHAIVALYLSTLGMGDVVPPVEADEQSARAGARVASTVPTQVSPRPAVSPSVQNEGEGNQGLDQVAQKAEGCSPLPAGAANAEVHTPDPSNVVTVAGEGEGAPTSVDPAPVPDAAKPVQAIEDDPWLRKRFPEKYQEVSP